MKRFDEEVQLQRWFDACFYSNEMRLRKPDAAAYLHVIKTLDLSPGEIAFFDDSLENVEGAVAVGIHGNHVQGFGDLRILLGRMGVLGGRGQYLQNASAPGACGRYLVRLFKEALRMASRSESIDQLAAKLDRDARSIPAVYLAIGLVAGLMFGVALGGDTVDVQRVAGIAYGLLGAFVGWSVGRSRQTWLKLQTSIARGRRIPTGE